MLVSVMFLCMSFSPVLHSGTRQAQANFPETCGRSFSKRSLESRVSSRTYKEGSMINMPIRGGKTPEP